MSEEAEGEKKLKFVEFCKVCEKISTASKDKRGVYLRKFINEFRRPEGGVHFFPILRLLLPQLDRDRGAYGLKEHALAQKYIKVLALPKESQDANRLLHFRAPKTAGTGAGDFGEVVYWVVKNRHTGSEELTVDQINNRLDQIAEKHAGHDPRGVDDELLWMIQRMSPLEIKWLTRILIKEMKLGFGHKGILNSYHPDAVEMYDVSNNLLKICEKLSDPSRRLHEIEVTLFDPFRPMLAERCDVQKVEKELVHGNFHFVETKWDGERCQIHFKDGEFKYFSRNGYEYTDSFGANKSFGSLSPRLINQFKSSVKSVILDGEMMPWNTKYKSFGSKALNIDVKSLRLGNVNQPCFCAFDILFLNGKVLTNKPMKERIEIMKSVLTPFEGVVVLTKSSKVKTGNEVMKFLNEAIDNREEGIILKHPDSVYKPNVRKGGWYKIKPEYTEGAMADLDMLIIGGYYGEGRRRNLVSHFLLGLAIPSKIQDGDPEEFQAVGRVGSGCTMEELAELGNKLDEHWNKCKTKVPPSGLYWTKEKPDLWIEPSKSVILQIKASEVVYSDAYPVKYTLRFPRIEKVRYDKRWQDCLTLEEFTELRTVASGKLISTHISAGETSPNKPKRMRTMRTAPTVSNEYLGSDLSRVKQKTKVFEGKELCVIVGNEEYSKKDIEIKVVENGGKIVQNPGNDTFCVISGNEKLIKIKNIASTGRHNVVTVDWFVACVDSGVILDFRPKDLIAMSVVTKKKMKRCYDDFDDSYTNPASIDSLKESLNKVKTMGNWEPMSRSELADLDLVLFNGPSPFAIFRHCTAYFVNYKAGKLSDNVNSLLKFAAVDFLFMGGKIINSIEDDELTHVVIHSSDLGTLDDIKSCNSRERKIYIVSEHWILESWKKRTCLDEQLFLL